MFEPLLLEEQGDEESAFDSKLRSLAALGMTTGIRLLDT
jgi:hypothetical protein